MPFLFQKGDDPAIGSGGAFEVAHILINAGDGFELIRETGTARFRFKGALVKRKCFPIIALGGVIGMNEINKIIFIQ